VITLTRETLLADSLAIAECCDVLKGKKAQDARGESVGSSEGRYPPGTACTFVFDENNRALKSLSLRLEATDTASALRNTFIRIAYDGHETVNVPAGNFFGTGYSFNPYSTLFSSTDSTGKMIFKMIMPFRNECTVSVVNESNDTLGIEAEAVTVSYRWDKHSMYFGASWHEYSGIEAAGSENTGGTGKHVDLSIAGLQGKGVYVGDAVTVINSADAWWGEGDEKIYVDNEVFPSSIGTGTEDYYGYAWCRPEPFSHPFISQPTGEGNFFPGMTVNMRYRSLDAIPFENGIRADIELWHWVKTKIDYSLTAYYYVFPGYVTESPRTLESAQKP
ncbi:MAG TPA: glycoside hydrolase family 172 protein, partial [Bacteroidales bacterium]|nr:glycoside hydrolase family 172 protein [Bacteroidales bacterium]